MSLLTLCVETSSIWAASLIDSIQKGLWYSILSLGGYLQLVVFGYHS